MRTVLHCLLNSYPDFLLPDVLDPLRERLLPRVHLDELDGVEDLVHLRRPLVRDGNHALAQAARQCSNAALENIRVNEEDYYNTEWDYFESFGFDFPVTLSAHDLTLLSNGDSPSHLLFENTFC